MPNLTILKEPGYIYDLLYVFSLYFDMDSHLQNDLNYNKAEEDTEFFTQTLKHFLPIADETQIFFNLKKNGRAFISTYYFNPYRDLFSTKYNFDFLINELSDSKRLIANLIDFYFPETEADTNSITELSRLIDSSEYEELIKRKLYSFFINPEPVIRKLIYELIAKEVILSRYYEANYQRIIEIQNIMNFELLKEQMKAFRDLTYLDNETIYVSICLINKNCINLMIASDIKTVLLGCDYKDRMDFFISQKRLPRLKDFGDVVTEQNRIDILDLLISRKEITIKDIEQLLSFTGSTAYYHMTMMMRFNMLKTRNQGRTILYSINEKYFESLIQILNKYIKQDGEK